MSETRDVATTPLVWCEMRDVNELPSGRVGFAADFVHERVRHGDGWQTFWSSAVVDMDNAAMAASLERAGFHEEAAQWRGRAGQTTTAPIPVPVVVLNVPDYPDPDGVTLVFLPQDIDRLLDDVRATSTDAQRTVSKKIKGVVRDMQDKARIRKAEAEAMTCAIPGCKRRRHFFDDKGIGYCKRHAEERGVRPHGKIA